MKNIIVNIQYCNSIACLFSTLMQAALSWNYFHADNDIIFLESVKKYKNSIEHAKKYRDAIHWSPSDCIKGLVEGNNVVIAYIKKNPLPWYLEEYYNYGLEETKNFIKDVKLLNGKDSNFTGKIYGSQY